MLECHRRAPFGMRIVWPRNVDWELFGPHRRSEARRALWGDSHSVWPALDSNAHTTSNDSSLLEQVAAPSLGTRSVQDSYSVSWVTQRCIILYVGKISCEENVAFLLHSFSTLLRSLHLTTLRPQLVLVGDGPDTGDLQSLCQTLNLKEGEDVIFEGTCFGEKLGEGYASADIFAVPSFTETSGQFILEALASGLPIVGIDAPSIRHLITPSSTGFLLPLPPPLNPPITSSSPLLPTSPVLPSFHWSDVFSDRKRPSPILIQQYANLLQTLVLSPGLRASMGRRASEEWLRIKSPIDHAWTEPFTREKWVAESEDDNLEGRLTQIGIGAFVLAVWSLVFLLLH